MLLDRLPERAVLGQLLEGARAGRSGVLVLRGDDPGRLDAARAELNGALDIGDEPPAAGPLILERINC